MACLLNTSGVFIPGSVAFINYYVDSRALALCFDENCYRTYSEYRQGNTSDKNNNKRIAVVTAMSKILKVMYYETVGHTPTLYLPVTISLDLNANMEPTCACIFIVRSVSPVFTCIIDASKDYDRVNHWTLSKKVTKALCFCSCCLNAHGLVL